MLNISLTELLREAAIESNHANTTEEAFKIAKKYIRANAADAFEKKTALGLIEEKITSGK